MEKLYIVILSSTRSKATRILDALTNKEHGNVVRRHGRHNLRLETRDCIYEARTINEIEGICCDQMILDPYDYGFLGQLTAEAILYRSCVPRELQIIDARDICRK